MFRSALVRVLIAFSLSFGLFGANHALAAPFGSACTQDNDCFSRRCWLGECVRGFKPIGATCTHPGREDECDVGGVCEPSSSRCASKRAKGAECDVHDQCMSRNCRTLRPSTQQKFCDNAILQEPKVCVVVNDAGFPGMTDDDVVAVIANVSDRLYDKTRRSLRLLQPIRRVRQSPMRSVAAVSEIDGCYRANLADPPNLVVVLAGPEPKTPDERQGFIGFSSELPFYCNEFTPSFFGIGDNRHRIPGAIIERDDVPLAHVITHEYLHAFAGGHYGDGGCNRRMGTAYDDAETYAFRERGELSFSWHPADFYETICPDALVSFDSTLRASPCPFASRGDALGQQCASNGECHSGLCDSARATTQPICVAPDRREGSLCLTDLQCRGNRVCDGMECRDPYTGPALANGDDCEFSRQCASGHCRLIGRASTRRAACAGRDLPDGTACLDDVECASELCHNGACIASGVADGGACVTPRQCASELCLGGTCQPSDLPNGAACIEDIQCTGGLCRQTDFSGTKHCVQDGLGLGRFCYDVEQCTDAVCLLPFRDLSMPPTSITQIRGVCGPKAPNGFQCVLSERCHSGVCFRHDFQNHPGECVPSKLMEGDDCYEDRQCAVGDCRRPYPAARHVEGQCWERAPLDYECAKDAQCDSNLCLEFGGRRWWCIPGGLDRGKPCYEDRQCKSERCVSQGEEKVGKGKVCT